VKEAYAAIAAVSKKPALPFDEMLGTFDFDIKLEANNKFTSRLLATKEESPTGHIFVNGRHAPMNGVGLLDFQ
jgi:UDP-glucose:glycoprotein glucosyltransferase